jgi:tryptophan-rich sensory protein
LNKPWFSPPDFVFGIAWSVLYFLMGLAAYRVYERTGWPSWALYVYTAQLALNLLWFVIFFDAKQPRIAQLENLGR